MQQISLLLQSPGKLHWDLFMLACMTTDGTCVCLCPFGVMWHAPCYLKRLMSGDMCVTTKTQHRHGKSESQSLISLVRNNI